MRELSPDLVLLDVQLPDLDGFDVASRLTGCTAAPAIVLTSSRDGSDFGPLIVRSGARGFVPKSELSGRASRRSWDEMALQRSSLVGARRGSPLGLAVRLALIAERPLQRTHGLCARSASSIGWSFIGTGLFAWWRRPQNRFGALLVAIGFAWIIGGLDRLERRRSFVFALLFGNLSIVLLAHMLLAFPSGRLETRGERRIVAAAGSRDGLLQVLALLVPGDTRRGPLRRCPETRF